MNGHDENFLEIREKAVKTVKGFREQMNAAFDQRDAAHAELIKVAQENRDLKKQLFDAGYARAQLQQKYDSLVRERALWLFVGPIISVFVVSAICVVAGFWK